MKKVLSLILAVLMLFSVCAVSSFATGTGTGNSYSDAYKEAGLCSGQAALAFKVGGGNYLSGYKVFDDEKGEMVDMSPAEIKAFTAHTDGWFYLLPQDGVTTHYPNDSVTLPDVTPPKGYNFQGWKNQTDKKIYAATFEGFTIPEGSEDSVIYFTPVYTNTAEVEEDTFAKVFGILSKIFGAVIGLLTGKGTAWGQAFMNNILDGIA